MRPLGRQIFLIKKGAFASGLIFMPKQQLLIIPSGGLAATAYF